MTWPPSFTPQPQGEYFLAADPRFDGSDGTQTVQLAPAREVKRDVLVAWDIDPLVRDRRYELEDRIPASPSFTNPPILCSRVARGAVATSAGIVVTEDGRWLVESVGKPQFAARVVETDAQWRIRVDEPRRYVDEDVAVIFAQFRAAKIRNYWHWVTDGLMRAAILQRAGVPENVRILIPEPVLSLHRESLATIGIREDRLFAWGGEPTRFRTVYLASAPPQHGADTAAIPISYIKEMVARSRNGPPAGRLWISRRHAGRRRIFNDEELFSVAAGLGFEEVLAETLTVREQADIFAQAEVIAGPHGAGLTNAVFMAPGTKVMEVSPPMLRPRQKIFFWNLAAAGRQAYGFGVGAGNVVDARRFERVLGDVLAATAI